MRMIAKMHLACDRALKAINNRKGQSMVEYLFMLAIIVAVVGLVGLAIKKFMPDLWETIAGKISGQANSL